MAAFGSREREIRRARTYSKRHRCQVNVEHVIKGRGKGRYDTVEKGYPTCWWHGTVTEIVAVYKNGVRKSVAEAIEEES